MESRGEGSLVPRVRLAQGDLRELRFLQLEGIRSHYAAQSFGTGPGHPPLIYSRWRPSTRRHSQSRLEDVGGLACLGLLMKEGVLLSDRGETWRARVDPSSGKECLTALVELEGTASLLKESDAPLWLRPTLATLTYPG